MPVDLKNLNKEQKQAVIFGDGPLLIVAGAGTGKTSVITKRIVWLIEQGKAKPEQILGLTFTEKAAEEMIERVDKLLPYSYADLWISTFHSFCQKVLHEKGLDIGLPGDFKVLDETSAWLLVKKNLNKFHLDYYRPLGNPSKFIHALLDHFSRCKDQAISPEDYELASQKIKDESASPASREAIRIREVAGAYCQYQQMLLDNNFLDFGDLINYCLKLFQKRPQILEKYRQKFQYILVDEFQDTNLAQYELVKMLAAPKNNLTACGDDDQSIYRWRGASFANIVKFRRDFPEAKEISLIQNYRSKQEILDLAHQFISLNNPNRLEYIDKIDKKLIAIRGKKAEIKHLHFRKADEEAIGIAQKILSILKKDKKTKLSDFAVLVRANETANLFSRTLDRLGIPCQFLALKGLYSQPVILDIISYFRLLDNYHESLSFYRTLTLPFLEIPHSEIVQITHYSSIKSQSIYQSLSENPLLLNLSPKTRKRIALFLSLLEKHSYLAREKSVSEVLFQFLEDFGFLQRIVSEKDRKNLEFIRQFFEKIKSFEESSLDNRLKGFMEQFNLEIESGEEGKLSFDQESGPDAVKIMTIHSAKGLEFKYVFIVGLAERRFPVDERSEVIEIPEILVKDIVPEGDVHLEEERRLFYVAMTRAKEKLFFTSAEDYGGVRKKRISCFLKELGYEEEITKMSEKGLLLSKKKEFKKQRKEKWKLPEHFSFTQFRAFQSCPLQYKFAHLLKIPVRGKAAPTYGKVMHNTLYKFLRLAAVGKTELKNLLEIYEKEWRDDWYESQEQKEEYRGSGRLALISFYEEFKKEKPEIAVINGRLALEQGFNLKAGEETIYGKIDRIDRKGDKVEIIDYKTGKKPDKLSPEDKEQLLLYQIAAEEIFGLNLEKLTYYYIDENKKLSFLGSDFDKQKHKEKITQLTRKIRQSNFESTPGWQCKTCDFKGICEHAKH